ncbi:hypothetical protein [Streptomyces sp. NPDC026673]|uniref:hypothetical protein n=1 Tax=Streptomyces sp. NPDC026673 TaxID=3155724 RepID=UPI0033DA64BE
MAVRQLQAATPDSDPPAPPAEHPRGTLGLIRLARYGPLAAGYAVFQSLFGVLPEDMSGGVARYAVSGLAGVSAGLMVLVAAVLARRRSEQQTTVPTAAAAAGRSPVGDLTTLMEGTTATLLQCRSTHDDPDSGRLTGWPHFLEGGEAGERPTAIGTAYGLHLTLELARPDGRLDAPALVDTLWRLRLADGGWAARTGVGVSRPEVSALVVGALSRAGLGADRLADAVGALERMVAPGADPDGLSRTYVATAVLRGLVRAAPASTRLAALRAALVAGTLRDPARDDLLCWGHWLPDGTGHRRPPLPSQAHTAYAVVALTRAAVVLGEDNQARLARQQGIDWLTRCESLDHQTEHLRRALPEPARGVDHIVVRHFTAAWVAKALLGAGPDVFPGDPAGEARLRARLSDAVARVRAAERDGVWEWDDDRERRPIWMTYQGLAVLRAYALAGTGGV